MIKTFNVLRLKECAPAPKAEQAARAHLTIQKSAIWYWSLILAIFGWSFDVEAAPRHYGSLPELVQDLGLYRAPDVSSLAPARAELVLENYNANLGTNRVVYLPVTMRLRTDPKKHWDNGGYTFDTDQWSIGGIACGPDSTLLGFVRCSGRTVPLEYVRWWTDADGISIPKNDAKSVNLILDLRSGTRLNGEAPFKLYYADNGRTFRMLLAQDLGYSVRRLELASNESDRSPTEAIPKGKQTFLSHRQLQVWLRTNQWFLPPPQNYAANSHDIPNRARDVSRALNEFEAAARRSTGSSDGFDSALEAFGYLLYRGLAGLPADGRREVDRAIRRDYSSSFDSLPSGIVVRLQRIGRVPPHVINDVIEFLDGRASPYVENVVYLRDMRILTRAADAMFDQLEGKPPAQSVIEGRRSWEEYQRKLASDQASIQASNQTYIAQIERQRKTKARETPILSSPEKWRKAPPTQIKGLIARYYLPPGYVNLEVVHRQRNPDVVASLLRKQFAGRTFYWNEKRGTPNNPEWLVIRAVLDEPNHAVWTTEFILAGPADEVQKIMPEFERYLAGMRFPDQ